MIRITKSATADTRTCDFANVTKETLLQSSLTHIGDVVKALSFFSGMLMEAAGQHDYDKLTEIDKFHADFLTGFKQTGWWDNHRKIHRHHLAQADGIPPDVNLVDVLEYISDCVMAGVARSGQVYDLAVTPELLKAAFHNTVDLLIAQVVIVDNSPHPALCPNCDKNPAEAPHPCPYQSEINSDEKPCTCCAACTQECALDV